MPSLLKGSLVHLLCFKEILCIIFHLLVCTRDQPAHRQRIPLIVINSAFHLIKDPRGCPTASVPRAAMGCSTAAADGSETVHERPGGWEG